MDGTRVRVDGHWRTLERLDKPIDMAEMLRFDGEIRSVTLSEHGWHWYAAINGAVEPPKHKHPQGSVGIDGGVTTLAIRSDGMRDEHRVLLRSTRRTLKRLNRALSRRQTGSGCRNHTRKNLAGFHRRIADKRLDSLHTMTTRIARTDRMIGVEDVHVAGMLRNRRLALSIADAGCGEMQRQLRYTSEWDGGILVEGDRFFPSSRLCPMCGEITSDLTLRDRTFVCACGYVADRDVHGAQHIEQEA
jgi:putative transposase